MMTYGHLANKLFANFGAIWVLSSYPDRNCHPLSQENCATIGSAPSQFLELLATEEEEPAVDAHHFGFVHLSMCAVGVGVGVGGGGVVVAGVVVVVVVVDVAVRVFVEHHGYHHVTRKSKEIW